MGGIGQEGLAKQLVQQFVPADSVMRSDACQYRGQGAKFEWVVIGDGDVMLALSQAGQADVATGLACSV